MVRVPILRSTSSMGNDYDPIALRSQSRVGRVLRGKWHLDQLVGIGGMAAVYAATHRNGNRAAVKILHTELTIDPGIRARFAREAKAANVVGHHGVVAVIDDDVAEDGALFLVMELLEGETLDARRVRYGGTIEVDEVLSIADRVLSVLVAAHEKQVIHRDLKPENILIDLNGDVKVLDFGIAKLQQDLQGGTVGTRSGAPMGTPDYMSPEQARGRWELVDGQSDLWALGATMFNILTGRMVHQGQTVSELLLSAMTEQAVSLAQVLPAASPALVEVVDRALAFDKAKRWPNAGVMQEAVRAAYHAQRGQHITTAPRLTVPPAASRTFGGTLATTGAVVSGTTGVDHAATRTPASYYALAFGIPAAAIIAVSIGIAIAWRATSPPVVGVESTLTSANPSPTSPASAFGTPSVAVPNASASSPTSADAPGEASAAPTTSARVPTTARSGRSVPIAVPTGNPTKNVDLLDKRK